MECARQLDRFQPHTGLGGCGVEVHAVTHVVVVGGVWGVRCGALHRAAGECGSRVWRGFAAEECAFGW